MEVGESFRGLGRDARQGRLRDGWGRTQLTGGLAVSRFRLQRLSKSAKK